MIVDWSNYNKNFNLIMYKCITCGEDFMSSRLDFICAENCPSCFQKSRPISSKLKNDNTRSQKTITFKNNSTIPIECSSERASCSDERLKEYDENEVLTPLKNTTSELSDDYLYFKENLLFESLSFKKQDITKSDTYENVDTEETGLEGFKPLSKKDSNLRSNYNESGGKTICDIALTERHSDTNIAQDITNSPDVSLEEPYSGSFCTESPSREESSSPDHKSSSDSEYEPSKFPDFIKNLSNGKKEKLKYCDSYLDNVRFEEIGKTDEGKKPYRCKECNLTFFSRLHFKNHRKLHSDDDEVMYTGWSIKIQLDEASNLE